MIQDVEMSEQASGKGPEMKLLLDKEERRANNTK
jgi:hypothetical protein